MRERGTTAGAARHREHEDVERLGDELKRVEPREGAGLLELAPLPLAAASLRTLEPGHQALLLEEASAGRRTELLTRMPTDERARMLAEVEAADDWIEQLPRDERAATRALVRYPPCSAGRMMTPHFLALRVSESASAAVERIRRSEPEVEAVYQLPVVEDDGAFVGVVELRDLLRGGDESTVGSLVEEVAEPLAPTDDQELAARRILAMEVMALPVIEPGGSVVGVVTIDDAMEVLQFEEAEDAALVAGASPLRRPYLAASLLRLVRTRVVWLVAAAAAGILTVRVLDHFESELQQVVALALFIPLLLGTGGNIGAQAATTVVRAMAVDDVRLRDLPRVVWREASVGVMLGGLLASLAALPVALVYEPRLALVVCVTLVSVCVVGTAAGSALPLAVGRFGGDPAVVSAPLITTLVDATGLLLYFLNARLVFDL